MIKQIQLLAGILFLAILGYSGLWYTAAFQAEKDIVALLGSWRDQGLKVEHGRIEHGGFPYRITIDIENLHIATNARGVDVRAKNIQLISHLWTPLHWLAETSGLQVSAAAGSTILTSDFMLASYRVHDDGKTLVAFDSTASKGFSLTRFVGQDVATPSSWQFFLRFGGTDDKTQSGLYGERHLGFKLAATGIAYNVDVIGGVSGPVIKDWTKEQLQNWSFEGGLLEVDKLTLTAGGGTLRGNGSLTLDDGFQPLGSASLTIAEGSSIARRLTDAGVSFETSLPEQGLVSLMLQNGSATINGEQLLPLKSVID